MIKSRDLGRVVIFDKSCTLTIKSAAIILMLIHHLFLAPYGIKEGLVGAMAFAKIAIVGKVCVCLFLFVSGIGLEASVKVGDDLVRNSIQRSVKLWIQYVYAVLISAAIGVLVFHDKFIALIPLSYDGLKNFMLTLTGLQFMLYYPGFNASWWYITLCLMLYMLFPLLHILLRRYGAKFVTLMLVLSFADKFQIPEFNLTILINYCAPFILGMYFIKDGNYQLLSKKLNDHIVVFIILHVALIAAIYVRSSMLSIGVISNKLDILIASASVVIFYCYYAKLHSLITIPGGYYLARSEFGGYLLCSRICNQFLLPRRVVLA